MEYRTLKLTLVSANELKKSRFPGRMDVYAVVFISGTTGKYQKQRTNTDKNGDSDPTWNFPMKFVIDEAAGLSNRLTLVVKIKAAGMFGGNTLGEVLVPVKELLEGVKADGKATHTVNYQVRTPSGKPKGFLSFSYEFGEKFTGRPEERVTAYPPRGVPSRYPTSYGATSGYYPNQQPAGYAYPNQQPGYGYYPPPQAPVVQPRRSGMGFGTGLLGGALGGLLIGDMMSGGGCGGGGCGGGGCGGGGCGGF